MQTDSIYQRRSYVTINNWAFIIILPAGMEVRWRRFHPHQSPVPSSPTDDDDDDSKPPTGREKKSQKVYKRGYTERLKSNPEFYRYFRDLENLRNKKYRKNRSAEATLRNRVLQRARQRRYMERVKGRQPGKTTATAVTRETSPKQTQQKCRASSNLRLHQSFPPRTPHDDRPPPPVMMKKKNRKCQKAYQRAYQRDYRERQKSIPELYRYLRDLGNLRNKKYRKNRSEEAIQRNRERQREWQRRYRQSTKAKAKAAAMTGNAPPKKRGRSLVFNAQSTILVI